jgi:hypothetical protein
MRNFATYTTGLVAVVMVAFMVLQPFVEVGSLVCRIVPVARAVCAPTAIQAIVSKLTIAPASAP